jgi:hypothetical protein
MSLCDRPRALQTQPPTLETHLLHFSAPRSTLLANTQFKAMSIYLDPLNKMHKQHTDMHYKPHPAHTNTESDSPPPSSFSEDAIQHQLCYLVASPTSSQPSYQQCKNPPAPLCQPCRPVLLYIPTSSCMYMLSSRIARGVSWCADAGVASICCGGRTTCARQTRKRGAPSHVSCGGRNELGMRLSASGDSSRSSISPSWACVSGGGGFVSLFTSCRERSGERGWGR